MAKRTDVHSPKNIITDDYEFVAVMTTSTDWSGYGAGEREAFRTHMAKTGAKFSQHEHGGSCHVCGAWMMDYAIFHHIPSNVYIHTGMDCAAHIEDGHDDAFKHVAKQRRSAVAKKKLIVKATTLLTDLELMDVAEKMFLESDPLGALKDCTAENGIALNWGFKNSQDYNFKKLVHFPLYTLADMIRNLVKYGSWSEKQQSFAVSLADQLRDIPQKVKEFEAAKAIEQANSKAAPEGRVTIEGEVLTVKFQESYYGITQKLLIKCDGFKVWCTCPASIEEVEKGQSVSMAITLTQSDDDSSFAFGKRPAKAEIK